MVLRVVLQGKSGVEFADPPGRDLLVNDSHSFAERASAIDRAFARWDLSHLHEFRFLDGRRIRMADTDEFGDREGELDDRKETLRAARLRVGDSFEYVFDFGDNWEHVCTLIWDDVDPTEEWGKRPAEVVPVFDWGAIPDQYRRVTPDAEDEDDGEGEAEDDE